jgi:hypothetical protein
MGLLALGYRRAAGLPETEDSPVEQSANFPEIKVETSWVLKRM